MKPLAHLTLLLFLLTCVFTSNDLFAQVCTTPGRDGAGGNLIGVINTYHAGAATATVGATSLAVTAASFDGAQTPIARGDLVLVIQMQDAALNSTNTNAYGDGVAGVPANGATNLNNAGRFEYVIATSSLSLGGGTLSLRGAGANNGLVYTYTNANASATHGQRRFQIVRVPQYSSAALTSSLTAQSWNGTTGGVLAFDVAGVLNLNGASVSVSGKGFRGGGGRQTNGGTTGGTNTDFRNLSIYNFHGQKGEGIAGTPRYVYDAPTASVIDTGVEGYPAGSTAQGAPANGGGGGTDGNIATNDQNSGGGGGANGGAGGRGGNTWSSNNATGGYGGASLTAGATRLVLGGGGGAGARNNSPSILNASSGGAGGGIVLMRLNSVSGTATINADGATGIAPQNDGGGGGGAGGSIMVVSTEAASLTGLRLNARGANGTSADVIAGSSGTAHGPGGGGGGGSIVYSGAPTLSVAGGASGTTSNGAGAYGATGGATGQTFSIAANSVSGVRTGVSCFPQLTVTKTTSTPNATAGGQATYAVTVANATGRGTATNLILTDTLPANFTFNTLFNLALNNGATRLSTGNPTSGQVAPAFSLFELPGGGSIVITFTARIANATPAGVYQNSATAAYPDPTRTTSDATSSATYTGTSSTAEDVTVASAPLIELTKTVTPTTQALPGTELTYTIAFINNGGSPASNFRLIDPDTSTTIRLNTNTDFKINSVTNTLGTTGLSPTVAYSSDNAATWTYAPTSGAGGAPTGYDRLVTHIRWTFTGNLSHTAPNNQGTVAFVVRVR